MFKVSGLKQALRSGKWMKDEAERQRLVEQVSRSGEVLLDDIMKWAKPVKTKMVDHRATQGDAFLELAAIGAIGVDSLFCKKYLDDTLVAEVIDAVEYKSGSLQFSHDKARLAAAILLIELSRLPDTEDYVPYILSAYPPSQKFNPATVVEPKADPDLIEWYFARLWTLINDERVVDFLIEMLDEDTHVIPPGMRSAKAGPGYHAAELLLLHGEERGIAALVPAILRPKKGMYIGRELFQNAYEFFVGDGQPVTLSKALFVKRGQFAMLARYLRSALKTEDYECQIRAAEALGQIGEKEAVNAQAIPMLLGFLAVKPQSFMERLSSKSQMMRQDAERALKELEPLWTPAPFLEALKHEDGDVRLYAVKALAKIGDKSTITALNALREDEDRKVKKEVEKAIKRLQK